MKISELKRMYLLLKMDLISHVFFGLFLYGRVDAWIILGAILPDVDKIITYKKGRFMGAESHTFLGELPAGVALILIFQFLSFFYPFLQAVAFGIMTHILLDYLVGETIPFRPFLKEKIDFNFSLRNKLILGIVIWVAGIAVYGEQLWEYARNLMV